MDLMVLQVGSWVVALPLLTSLTVLTVEIVAGLRPLSDVGSHAEPRSLAVLIPAHDEAGGIAATLAALRDETSGNARILVVADNCTDATADVARAAGAEVIERSDPTRRGKGFALSFGRDHLTAEPPEVVVVLDADCRFVPGSLRLLAAVANRGVPAQATNLLIPDREAPPLVQISSFALLVKNRVRARATIRLGGAALLTGTGMAFPWPLFAVAPLASGNIVEDLGLGLELVRAGVRPQLVELAEVRSAAAAQGDTHAQRRRWEHGVLSTALRQAPKLLIGGLVQRSAAQFVLGAHLLVPPLALLLALSTLALAALSVLAVLGAGWRAPLSLLTVIIGASAAILVAWRREGRDWLSSEALLRAPFYVLWKLPLYARFIVAPEARWRRTRRPG